MANTYDMLLVPEDRIDDIEPMDNQIVVRVEFPKSKTTGGIILAQKTLQREIAARIIGTVIKAGPKVILCNVGDEVIYAKYSGTVVSRKDESIEGAADGYEIRIMDETQVISKLKNTKGDK